MDDKDGTRKTAKKSPARGGGSRKSAKAPGSPSRRRRGARFVELTPTSPALGTQSVHVNPDNVVWLEDRLLPPDHRTAVLHFVGQPLAPLEVNESAEEVAAAFEDARSEP